MIVDDCVTSLLFNFLSPVEAAELSGACKRLKSLVEPFAFVITFAFTRIFLVSEARDRCSCGSSQSLVSGRHFSLHRWCEIIKICALWGELQLPLYLILPCGVDLLYDILPPTCVSYILECIFHRIHNLSPYPVWILALRSYLEDGELSYFSALVLLADGRLANVFYRTDLYGEEFLFCNPDHLYFEVCIFDAVECMTHFGSGSSRPLKLFGLSEDFIVEVLGPEVRHPRVLVWY